MEGAEGTARDVARYDELGVDDRAALGRFHAIARPHLGGIAQRFYERVLDHPDASSTRASAGAASRLCGDLAAWIERMLSGPWDEDYVALRGRIGRTHVRLRLPQRPMFRALGRMRGELEGVVGAAIVDPAEATAVRAALDRLLELELSIMLETIHENYVAAVQRFERAGKTLLERRLAISEARYEAVVENAAVAVVAVEADGRIALSNRRAEALGGAPRTAAENVYDRYCDARGRAELEGAVRAAIHGGTPPPLDVRLDAADGRERWLRWHIAPLPSADAPLACAIGVDITEERTLAERTRRVEGLASLGELAAGLAHEIRNPLNAAQLQLLVVERRVGRLGAEDSSSAIEAARTVRDELHRLAGLVEDFLAFARPSELRIAGGDLAETAATVASFLAPDALQAGVALEVEATAAVLARYDEERVKQVLINLVRNAIEAAGRGGAARVIVGQAGPIAVLEVRDSGAGVPPGVRVFDPFTTTKSAGTGLGLSIVHRIVHDHGGDVRIERRSDETVFRVELPLGGPSATRAR